MASAVKVVSLDTRYFHPRAAIFVCEDLLDQQEWEIDTFQIDFHRGIRFKRQLVETYPLTVTFGLLTQSDLAISVEWHDEVFIQVVVDEQHVLGGTIPHIAQDIAKWNRVAWGGARAAPDTSYFY
jgi:hypothetical protein